MTDMKCIGDADILAILPKDPVKFCLQGINVLFSRDEMAKGRYEAVRQRRERRPNPPTLYPQKVWLKMRKKALIQQYSKGL